MYAIEVQTVFSAAHALRLPGGAVEPLHGHDFHVTVRLVCQQLDALETVVDFHAIESALAQITAPWRSKNLNDMEPFRSRINPSAERIAETLGVALQLHVAALDAAEIIHGRFRLAEVRITEAPGCLAIWTPS